ncbi:MAG: ABC transporter permease, partial [Crocinitomicaceae bacterium]
VTNKADDAVQFNWNGMTGSSKISWEVGGPREVELIARTQNEQGEIESDTMLLTFDMTALNRVSELSRNGEIDIEFENNSFKISGQNKTLIIRCDNPSYKEGAYISGYEIGLTDFSNLEGKAEQLRNQLQLKPDKYGNLVQVTTVKEVESDLFAWLDFLDVNVYIIITLMLLIGVINVGSAILVIIVVRTNFVGIMKAMGASNWSIRKVFVYEAGYLIVKGLVLGNVLGIGLCYLQMKWKVFLLDPSVYYLDAVPIHFSWMNLLLINLLTIVVCLLALVIPSIVVT